MDSLLKILSFLKGQSAWLQIIFFLAILLFLYAFVRAAFCFISKSKDEDDKRFGLFWLLRNRSDLPLDAKWAFFTAVFCGLVFSIGYLGIRSEMTYPAGDLKNIASSGEPVFGQTLEQYLNKKRQLDAEGRLLERDRHKKSALNKRVKWDGFLLDINTLHGAFGNERMVVTMTVRQNLDEKFTLHDMVSIDADEIEKTLLYSLRRGDMIRVEGIVDATELTPIIDAERISRLEP